MCPEILLLLTKADKVKLSSISDHFKDKLTKKSSKAHTNRDAEIASVEDPLD